MPAWALFVPLAWVLVLVFAPPASNWVWAVNGFASLPIAGRAGVALAATALGALALSRGSGAVAWTIASAALALVVAFPLREQIHFLGDTLLRHRNMLVYGEGSDMTLGTLMVQLHAMPLDFAIGCFLPIQLHRLGLPMPDAISVVSAGLAALFFAGTWRLTGRLVPADGPRLAVALAIVLGGALEAWAGYAESSGLILALLPWWWMALLDPLPNLRRAVGAAALWGAMILSHRMALVLVLPMMWRALGPALEGDRPAGRRGLAVATVAVAAASVIAVRWSVGPQQFGADFADAFAMRRGQAGVGLLSAADIANLVALVAPLAVLAPFLAGRRACAAWLGSPQAKLALAAAIPLLPLAIVLPAGPHGLGAHRDWDLAVMAGWTLTFAGASIVASAGAPRARAALRVLVPVLALGAGSWLAVNAHEPASARRAVALATRPPLPAAPHVGPVLFYLAERAMSLGDFAAGADYYERAYESSPNPRFLLLAAQARIGQGDVASARRDLSRARENGGLSVRGLETARQLEAILDARSGAPPPRDSLDTIERPGSR